jgi:1,4-dihydroxy-2-naphthoate octaprenyltransferase
MKSILLHLRIPFSFFLLPVYLFALSLSPNFYGEQLLWSFVIIHLFLYPASNAYNSYFDKDEKSIGVLRNPPPVDKKLYYTALMMDVVAIIMGFWKINVEFVVMLVIYGLISKAYSHPGIRLKKYAVASWLVVVVFQGFFSLMMCYMGINNFGFENILKDNVVYAGILSSLLLFASYPLTQVYQHAEDGRRGDRTMSMLLGIRGTFYFAMVFFTLTSAGFAIYFNAYFSALHTIVFLASLLPVVTFFMIWFLRVLEDETKADFSGSMRLTFISSLCLNIFFLWLFLDTSHVLQALQ